MDIQPKELDLSNRMKAYEQPWERSFKGEPYMILRLDGNAFHTYTRGMKVPFDDKFVSDMNTVAEVVSKKIIGSQFAFTQSDEISILITPLKSETEESGSFFSGRVSKILSLSAALASATLARLRPEQEVPLFDARIFSLPTFNEVQSYFIWRQRDTIKNSAFSFARSIVSHKSLIGKKRFQMLSELEAMGRDWNTLGQDVKYGRLSKVESREAIISYVDKRTLEEHTVVAMRKEWKTVAAPHFEENEGRAYLNSLIGETI